MPNHTSAVRAPKLTQTRSACRLLRAASMFRESAASTRRFSFGLRMAGENLTSEEAPPLSSSSANATSTGVVMGVLWPVKRSSRKLVFADSALTMARRPGSVKEFRSKLSTSTLLSAPSADARADASESLSLQPERLTFVITPFPASSASAAAFRVSGHWREAHKARQQEVSGSHAQLARTIVNSMLSMLSVSPTFSASSVSDGSCAKTRSKTALTGLVFFVVFVAASNAALRSFGTLEGAGNSAAMSSELMSVVNCNNRITT